MKSTVILLLLLVGCTAAWRRSGRGRRNGADPTVTAINCITSQCAAVAMPLMQKYQMLFQSWGDGPTAMTNFFVNVTTDEAELAKICTDYKSLIDCPAEKCTLTDDLRAIIEAMDLLDYPCEHQADVRAHATCLMGAFTKERIEGQFADGSACKTKLDEFNEKYSAVHSHARGYVSRFPVGGSASLRRRRQLIPQITENPFPELKRRLAAQFDAMDTNTPSCEDMLTMIDCAMKPAKDDCGAGALTLLSETVQDMSAKQEKFIKAFAPNSAGKYPDIGKCLKEREDATTAFFKLFFF